MGPKPRNWHPKPSIVTFGREQSKSCALRFHNGQNAKQVLRILRNGGPISFTDRDGVAYKIRVVRGFDDRTDEATTIDYQLRKLRSAIMFHGIETDNIETAWATGKIYLLPEGTWGKRICFSNWNPKVYKLPFLKELMKEPVWKSIRFHWNALIDSSTADADFDAGDDSEHEGGGEGSVQWWSRSSL